MIKNFMMFKMKGKKIIENKKGGTDQFKGYVFGFILLTLFTFLILTFTVQFAQDNNKDTTELEEGAFDLDPYRDTLDSVDENAENFRERFEKGSIWSSIAGVVVSGIFGIGTDMVSMIITPFTLFAQILTNVFHVPTIVTSVLLGLIILGVIFGLWALIKKGD